MRKYDSIGWFAAPHLYHFTMNTAKLFLGKNRLKVEKSEENEWGLSLFCNKTDEVEKWNYDKRREISDVLRKIRWLKMRRKLLAPLRIGRRVIRETVGSK